MARAVTPIVLDDRALLDVWEQGASVPAVWRPAAVVAAVAPDLGVPAARLSIGARDTVLLAVRVGTVGPRVDGVVGCPSCGAELDVEVDAAAMLAGFSSPDPEHTMPSGVTDDATATERVELDGVVATFRNADTTDLAAVAHLDPSEAARALLERCVLTIAPPGTGLEAHLAEAVSARMAATDPASDITLRVECAMCGHEWSAPWDVADFVWHELDVAARAVVAEVDALARRYGWREPDVLAMTRVRRRTYLELP